MEIALTLRLPYRWPVIALGCCAHFVGSVLHAALSGDTDDALM